MFNCRFCNFCFQRLYSLDVGIAMRNKICIYEFSSGDQSRVICEGSRPELALTTGHFAFVVLNIFKLYRPNDELQSAALYFISG